MQGVFLNEVLIVCICVCFQILEEVQTILDEALHKHMTEAVLNLTQHDTEGSAFFDDFVGDGDLDAKNNTVVSCVFWLFSLFSVNFFKHLCMESA